MLPLHAIPQLPPLVTSHRTLHRTTKFLPSDNNENFQLNNIYSTYYYRFTEQAILWLLFGRCWLGQQPSTCHPYCRFKESSSIPPDRCRGDLKWKHVFCCSSFTSRDDPWSYSCIVWDVKNIFKQIKLFFLSDFFEHYHLSQWRLLVTLWKGNK